MCCQSKGNAIAAQPMVAHPQTLKDPARRTAYDRHIAASRARISGAIAEELDLDDLTCRLIPDGGGGGENSGPGGKDNSGSGSGGGGGSVGGENSGGGGGAGDGHQQHRFEHLCRCGGAYVIDEGQ